MNKPFDHPRAVAADVRLRVRVRLNRRRLWRWQLWLVEALTEHGHIPEVVFVPGEELPIAVRLLLALERMVFGLAGEHACDLIDVDLFAAYAAAPQHAGSTNIVLDLADAASTDDVRRRLLRPSYDGATSEDALIGALLDGRRLHLSVGDSARQMVSARPAVRDPRALTRALDNVFSTLLVLCVKAIDNPDARDAQRVAPQRATQPTAWRTARFLANTAAAKATGRLTKMCGGAQGWSIQWRWASDDRIALTHTLPSLAFHDLADDGRRYYADPFVFEMAGVHYLFCEDYDYARGKGVISMTTVPRDGEPAPPRPVLETSHHLSYPSVFAHGGQIWMVPESCTARTVDLYRADPFPHRWVHEATLLSGVSASDATLVEHGGEWWMFAEIAERQSSTWDALSIFHSPDLFGPWAAHAGNPVLIDASAARPAGHFYRQGGKLWRPVQDCRADYGSALALCTVDQLDAERFAQTVHARLKIQDRLLGPHTLNWSAGLEVIDSFR